MKIGFTGAGGTGKTTAMNLVKDELKLPVLPSNTREVFEKWGLKEDDQEQMSFEDKLTLQNDIFDMRAKVEGEAGDSFISDRTLLDNFAYSQLRCYLAMDQEMFKQKEKQVAANLRQYDFIFYFPIHFTPPSDEMRQANYTFLKVIDSIIYSFLLRNHIPFITVSEGSPLQRSRQIRDYISGVDDAACWGNG